MSPIKFLPTVIERLASRFHPGKIILFGSCARNGSGEGNDLDLLVVFKEITGKKREQTVRLMSAISDLPVAVDCIIASVAEMESEKKKQYSIIAAAQREGRVVYESN